MELFLAKTMNKVTADCSMLTLMGVVEVGYWHNGTMVDFELVTGVKIKDVELVYGKAHCLWFGKVAATILN